MTKEDRARLIEKCREGHALIQEFTVISKLLERSPSETQRGRREVLHVEMEKKIERHSNELFLFMEQIGCTEEEYKEVLAELIIKGIAA